MATWEELRDEGAGSLARAMGDLFKFFQAEAARAYEEQGWPGASLAQVEFLSKVSEDGSRLTDIAVALGTTKQYVGRVAQDLAERKIIAFHDDTLDRRAVVVKPGPRGQAFLSMACQVRSGLEQRLVATLGPELAGGFARAVHELGRLVAAERRTQVTGD